MLKVTYRLSISYLASYLNIGHTPVSLIKCSNFDIITSWISALGVSDSYPNILEQNIMNCTNAIDLFQCGFNMLKVMGRLCISILSFYKYWPHSGFSY
jgi:hypothetical protein